MKNSKSIIQATTVLTAITLVVKGLGFVEKILLAYFFGTGIEVDAYLIAYSLPFSAFVVLRDVVRASFVPTLMRTWRNSRREGWRLFSIVGTLLLVLMAGATVVGMLAAPPLVSLIAPGFTGEQRALALRLTRMVMPALLLLGLSTLTTATLHAQKRFNLPALGDASFRAGPLILLVGVGGIPAMAVGVVLGALGKLVIETLGLWSNLRRVRLAFDLSFPPVRTVGRLAAPLLAGLFFSLFIGPLVENAFATKIGVGGVSALAYARKIVETLAAILPYTLGLVLLPFSAEMAAGEDRQGLARTLTGAVRALTLIFLPATVGLLVLCEPFVQLLFERGAFTAASTQLTAGALLFYALALLPFALEVIVVQFHFARQDTLTPVIADVVTFALNVALIPPFMAAFGLGGIALAAAIAKTVKVLALLVLFGRKVPTFRLASLGPFAGQMALASLAATGALIGFQTLEQSLGVGSLAMLVAYLVGAAIVGGGTFVIAAYLLKVDEVRDLWRRGCTWCRALVGGSLGT
ncbi:MAG: murein biosynthesis integral membrane protein MurJ [Anaerolineae bacterium]|jgi:putative peptidoglycan lipid II flippase